MDKPSSEPIAPRDTILWDEYKHLSTAAQNIMTNSFQVPAVAIALVTALAISGNIHVPYLGFGIMTGLFLLSIWLAYYHCALNTYSLHLVELEQKINRQLSPNSPYQLTYYTRHIGRVPRGSNVYGCLLGLLVLASMFFSVVNVWKTTQSWNWGWWSRISCVIGLLLPSMVSFANMVRMEAMFKEMTQALLRSGDLDVDKSRTP